MTKKANAIVEEMVTAMGGMKNYDAAHFIQWDFVNRKLLWNKWTGDVRIENPSANQVLVNINTLKGKVYENGTLVQDEIKLMVYLKREGIVD
jgi:hypothetical protein